ncbi:MAG TPA: cardiolipin synthase ClsB [Burkholderiales bacterium]
MRYVGGNRLTLLRNGEQYFPALLRALDAAEHEVFLETYIFADDDTGKSVAAALARAAGRGAAVHLLIDGFGARDFSPRLRELLLRAGVRLLAYRPLVSPWTLRRNRLRRMHRKLVCVDGTLAFVGGINIIDDYDTPHQKPPRYDYAVKIEGTLVNDVRREAARFWRYLSWAKSGRRPAASAKPCASHAADQKADLVVRDNVRHRRDIERAYLELLASAREEVIIANAYFFPGRRFRQALARAAARGVRVTLLLQGRVEYALLHYASRALYSELLAAGIAIHEYHRSFLHAKVAVVDGQRSCVGSSNIDVFSLLLAKEANVFVDDAAFSQALRASLLEAIERGARPVPPQRWQRRSWWLRLRIRLAFRLARLFIVFAGVERYT